LASSINNIWTSIGSTHSILEGYQVKKMWALGTLIAIAILSGSFLYNLLNWAGEREVFDFDLNEDIDHETY
jgi:hypothetical protein